MIIMNQDRKPFCQSCGLAFAMDTHAGTNSDGSHTDEFCKLCYQNGSFLDPNITVEEMMRKIQSKLVSMKLPKFIIAYMTKHIPELKRWKKTQDTDTDSSQTESN
jgi:hypothetical protein